MRPEHPLVDCSNIDFADDRPYYYGLGVGEEKPHVTHAVAAGDDRRRVADPAPDRPRAPLRAAAAARAIRRASAEVRASGFSHRMCLPASAAARIQGAWRSLGRGR